MHPDALFFFDRYPEILPVYEALERRVTDELAPVHIKVQKTQIAFSCKYGFAYAWPPVRKFRGGPELYLGITFGLAHRLEHPRIVRAVEPYPGRWTHHTLAERTGDIDDTLMAWIRAAHAFSMSK